MSICEYSVNMKNKCGNLMISNKKIGSNFEKDFANFLASKGYWVAPFPRKKSY